MDIIKHARHVTHTVRYHLFDYEDEPGRGCIFEVDEDRNVISDYETSKHNYRACLTGEVDGKKIIDRGISVTHRRVRVPAVGRCCCGREVELHGDVTCACGREYNSFGQLLAPRSCWGEETGETVADIIGPA